MMRWLISLSLTIAVLGAARAQPAPSGPQLGKSLAGEICHADNDPAQARPIEIFCGDSNKSVGRMQITTLEAALPDDVAKRRAMLSARAKPIADALAVSEQLSCDAGAFLGQGEMLLYLCTLQSTSWPRLLLFAGSGRTIAQAEGMPSLLPVLGTALAAALGRRFETGDAAAGQQLLATRIPANVLSAAAGDFARYSQSIEAARIYASRDDFAAAETALRGALEIDTHLFGADSVPVGLALMELAVQVSNQGRFDEAAGLFHRASPIIEGSLSADARAQLASYLALDAANQRDFAKALAYAHQASVERREQLKIASGGGEIGTGLSGLPVASSGELAHSLRIEAEMALKLGDLPNAQAAAEEALWIVNLEPGLALWWRADVLTLMAEVNERRGRVSAAERNYLDAITMRQKLFGDSAPLAMAHLMMGRFYAEQELYPQAVEQFRLAMGILSRSPIARARIMPDQLLPFLAAASGWQVGPQQRAMLDTEVFRAVQLVNSDLADQAIARASVRLAAANPALAGLVRDAQDAQQMRDQLRIDIAAELAKSGDERNVQLETLLAQKLVQATARADDLAARVQKEFPDYARLADPQAVELADVRSQLKPGQGFLTYLMGFKGSYGLLVTADGLTVKKLDVTSDSVTSDIALLRRAFQPQLGRLPDFSLRNAYTLYQQLLGPFAGPLQAVNQLTVAPGPVLASVPLSLLVDAPPADGASYAEASWLVRRMSVTQVPSPRAFLVLRQTARGQHSAPRPFLGVGDPVLTGSDGGGMAALESLATSCRQSSPMPAALLRGLEPLHDTAGEVRSVSQALGGDADSLLLGPAASETGFRAHALDQYRVLYFATHGLLPGELHCQAEPGLVLSPPPTTATSTDGDGLLEAGEIAALRLNADLVVLSACNTAAAGSGRFGGSALEGLADAFFNAGARAVLASHWEIPSTATAKLMTDVFQRYGRERGGGLAGALRQAQLDMIGDPATAHPFYWAAFTLIGAGEGAGGGGIADMVQQTNGGRL
ncbi:MAG TPA: CHAT domain-containing tetratricopeptide repeat protein [Rhizomicrobium sp.]|nr:CHAT domain-containing tetratricopeptide repeat protein [Rhizomicrobium sp.]